MNVDGAPPRGDWHWNWRRETLGAPISRNPNFRPKIHAAACRPHPPLFAPVQSLFSVRDFESNDLGSRFSYAQEIRNTQLNQVVRPSLHLNSLHIQLYKNQTKNQTKQAWPHRIASSVPSTPGPAATSDCRRHTRGYRLARGSASAFPSRASTTTTALSPPLGTDTRLRQGGDGGRTSRRVTPPLGVFGRPCVREAACANNSAPVTQRRPLRARHSAARLPVFFETHRAEVDEADEV